MPLTDIEILDRRNAGDLVIEPFDPKNLGTDTYDVCLGPFYYRETGNRQPYDIFDPEAVARTWGKVQFPRKYRPAGHDGPKCDVIWIEPGETILAHTIEFIGARVGYTTKMFSRSSVGRSLLGVCKCAGRGDIGYFNRWTMEITSFARFHPIPLRVGMRIAQIEFIPVGRSGRVYGRTHGKYQQSADLEKVMCSWRPEMMLPRLNKDQEVALLTNGCIVPPEVFKMEEGQAVRVNQEPFPENMRPSGLPLSPIVPFVR
jgi:dCTP deaminase